MKPNARISAAPNVLRAVAPAVAGLALVLLSQQARPQTGTEMTADNKATILRSFEAWANGTGGPYYLLDEDAE
jgi:hypothetical protein